jgi:integrase
VDSPAKRGRLAARRNPYWQPCGPKRGGLSLGYRKPERGAGAWIARLIRDGERIEHRLGEADDAGAGPDALAYARAVSAAMEWGARQTAANADAKRGDGSPLTVRAAVTAYLAERKARNLRHGRNAETRLTKRLLSDRKLADRPLAKLTESDLASWARGLTGMEPASVARLLNDARAALNRAHDLHHRALPPGWRDVVTRGLRRPAMGAGKAPPLASHHRAVLTDADMRKIVEAALAHGDEGDFGRLVAVLAATGARFSQVARLTVADVIEGAAPRLMVPTSMKGRDPSRKASHVAVPVGSDLLTLLRPALAGRAGSEPLLMRWLLRMVPGDKKAGLPRRWVRDRRTPWRDAFEMTPFWKAALARAGLAAEIEPYRLRDASIIRALRAGQPVRLVAAQHDTSVAMIEKHYAQHIGDALADLARKAVVPVVSTPPAALRAVTGTGG